MSRLNRRRCFRASIHETHKRSHFISSLDAHIGNRLLRTRIFRDLTRRELALGIGATERQVEAFESGAIRMDAHHVRRIGRVLNVRPSFFLRRLSRGICHGSETKPPAAAAETSRRSVEESAGERVKQIFESINSPRIRELLVELMLVITTSEATGSGQMM